MAPELPADPSSTTLPEIPQEELTSVLSATRVLVSAVMTTSVIVVETNPALLRITE
jgi:hypothetical protein